MLKDDVNKPQPKVSGPLPHVQPFRSHMQPGQCPPQLINRSQQEQLAGHHMYMSRAGPLVFQPLHPLQYSRPPPQFIHAPLPTTNQQQAGYFHRPPNQMFFFPPPPGHILQRPPHPQQYFYDHHPQGSVGQQQKQCSNCGTSSTPSWRRCPEGKELLCNACGLYAKLHNRPRPFKMAEDGSVRVVRSTATMSPGLHPHMSIHQSQQPTYKSHHPFSQPRMPCEQCGMEDTAAWRGNHVLCSTCAHYIQQIPQLSSYQTSSQLQAQDNLFLASLVTGDLADENKPQGKP